MLEKNEIKDAFSAFKKEFSAFLPKENADEAVAVFCIQTLYIRGQALLNTFFGHYSEQELLTLLKEADGKKEKPQTGGRRGELRTIRGGKPSPTEAPPVQSGTSLEPRGEPPPA